VTLLLQLALFSALVQVAPQATPKTATIDGTVTNAGSGSPLEDAGVELSRVGGAASESYIVATRADGTFSFQDVPAGDYRIAAARPGFLRAEYGQRGPGGNGLTVTVAAGDQLKGFKIPLTEAGAISGRVLDRNGRPVANAQVQAFRLMPIGGLQLLDTVRAVLTNDRGEYRLFWLAPEEYLVMAIPIRGAVEDQLIKTDGNGSNFTDRVRPPAGEPILAPEADSPLPYFYGGTNDPEAAARVRIRAGEDLGGIDIAIHPVTTYTLRGKVLNLPARTTPRSQLGDEPDFEIRLEPRKAPDIRFRNEMPNGLVTVDGNKGTFEVRGVLPGEYWAYARVVDYSPGGQTRPARALVDIAGRDVEDVVISFSQGFDIPVHLVLEGPENQTLLARLMDSLRLWVNPADGGRGMRAERAPDLPPGTFIARNVPAGEYRVGWEIIGGFSGAYYKTTSVEGVDRPDSFRIDRAPTRPIEVVFAPATGTVTGNVTAPDATVVAIGARGSYYARSGPDGRFQITNIPPGDFTVYAWESIPIYTWQDPAVMQRAAGRGTRVHLDDGSSVTVSILALPAEGTGK
jgi:carboxypeptidase family protein